MTDSQFTVIIITTITTEGVMCNCLHTGGTQKCLSVVRCQTAKTSVRK